MVVLILVHIQDIQVLRKHFHFLYNKINLYTEGQKKLYHSFKFSWKEKEREMFYLTMHSTHFIYGYMASFW